MGCLYTNHGNIEYEYLFMNKHRLTKPFDPTQPILNIFNRYKNIITKGGHPISSHNKISLEYVLLKSSGAYDRSVEDWYNITAYQKTWARFKTYSVTTYHKFKKQIKGQVNNIMNGEILDLIADKLQKVATQFDEGQQQIANFSRT